MRSQHQKKDIYHEKSHPKSILVHPISTESQYRVEIHHAKPLIDRLRELPQLLMRSTLRIIELHILQTGKSRDCSNCETLRPLIFLRRAHIH